MRPPKKQFLITRIVRIIGVRVLLSLLAAFTLVVQQPTCTEIKAAEFVRRPASTGSALGLYKTITLGEDLQVNLLTDLPSGVNDVRFFLMKKTASATIRSGRFGLSGVQGEWDIILSHLSNQYWDPDKSGEEMLEKHFAMLSALGISQIRTEFTWERVEPQKGTYDFTNFDKIFEMAKKHKLNLLVTLGYTPPWMYNRCPGKNATKPWFTSPDDLNTNGSALYNRYASKVVERYRPFGVKDPSSGYGIAYWQIWNEPDISFWTDCQTGAVGNLETYSSLLKSAYRAIKSVSPQAMVVMGGLTHLDPSNRLRQIYSYLGDDRSFDVLDMHYYETSDGTAFTDKVSAFARVRDHHGDQDKEIWITETGTDNQSIQSAYLASIFSQIERLGVRNVGRGYWWTSRGYILDVSEPKAGSENAMFENNFYPRKVYFDYGTWLGTTVKKAEIQAPPVSGGRITAVIPKHVLDETGEYIFFYASPSKMVTAPPMRVIVK